MHELFLTMHDLQLFLEKTPWRAQSLGMPVFSQFSLALVVPFLFHTPRIQTIPVLDTYAMLPPTDEYRVNQVDWSVRLQKAVVLAASFFKKEKTPENTRRLEFPVCLHATRHTKMDCPHA